MENKKLLPHLQDVRALLKKRVTSALRQAVRLARRRDAVASDVYRAVCDIEHMNKTFPDDPQLSFHLDFVDDLAERRVERALGP
jgi:hypothetical protein